MTRCFFGFVLVFIAFLARPVQAQTPATTAPLATPEQVQLLKTTEAFVRDLFAWGPEFKVNLGPLSPSVSPDFYIAPVHVTVNEQTDTGVVYVSKDGKTILRGEMYDMSSNPFADNVTRIHLDGNPTRGPATAHVTVVVFSDFQCPHCLLLYRALKTIEPQYPQVRFVFEDFPLIQIHPWAETAAIGARCAFTQSPAAYWKVHGLIFDNQDLISTENVYEKLVGFASQGGLDAGAFKTCMSSPEAKQAVDANHADGEILGLNSTPTVYINGRPLPGGDPAILNQYIKYELAAHPK